MRDSSPSSSTVTASVIVATLGFTAVVLLGLIGGPGVFAPSLVSAQAQTVTLEPLKDNTLYEDPAGALSNGAGQHFFAGNNGNGSTRRGIVAFDIAGAIPAGSAITGIGLTLSMSRTTAGTETVELNRGLADWGEGSSLAASGEGGGAAAASGDATWTHSFSPDRFWATAGGDFSSTMSGAAPVDGIGPYTWSSPGMVSDVQAWLDNPSANFGWVLLGNEGVNRTSKRFDSREHGTAANRPQLEVQFTLPEPPTPTPTAPPTATPTPAPTPTPLPSTGRWGLVLVTLLMAAVSALYLRGAIGAGRHGT